MAIPIIGDIIDAAKDLVSEVIVDKDKKNEINLELEKIKDQAEARAHLESMGQIATNQIEAQHRSIFVAGWRPFIGWVSGFGVAWTFVFSPFVEWVSRLFGWTGDMPVMDTGQLMTLVLAMLGLAGYRSYDKAKGTANDVLSMVKPKKGEPENILPASYDAAELPEDGPWMK